MENITHQFTYTSDKQRAKKARQRYWLRSNMMPRQLVRDGLAIAGFVYLLVIGDRDWIIGVLGTLIAVAIFTELATYFIPLKQLRAMYDQVTSKEVTILLNEDCISTKSEWGYSEMPWSLINKIWKFSDFWMLFSAKTTYFPVPITAMDAETQAFIIRKVSENGGKVV